MRCNKSHQRSPTKLLSIPSNQHRSKPFESVTQSSMAPFNINSYQPSLLELCQCYPVAETLSSYLSLADCVALYRTSKDFYHLRKDWNKVQFPINRLLSKFVTNPQRFRSRMGKYGGLIWGIFALNLFERGRWDVPALDIALHQPTEVGDSHDSDDRTGIIKYLVDQEGYKADMNHYIDNPREDMVSMKRFQETASELRSVLSLTNRSYSRIHQGPTEESAPD